MNSDCVDAVVGFADAFHLLDFETSELENPPQLEIWLRAVNSMNDPFYVRQAIQPGIPLGKRRQRHQHTFTPALDLGEFDDQPA